MSHLILDIVRRKVDPSKVRRVSSNKGGEYHSPCPVCGGDDRFHLWPSQEGGATAQRAGVTGTFWCRSCDHAGDAIALLQFSESLDYRAACRELSIELDTPGHTFRPLRQPRRDTIGWTPKQWPAPSAKWRTQASKLALAAHERLLDKGHILAYLAGRGLPLAAVQQYRLGYLAGEGKAGVCLYRARAAFDLTPKKSPDGSAKPLWIPRGLVIPLWVGDEVHRIRLRRHQEDLRPGEPEGRKSKDAKYLLLEGSGQAPMTLPPMGVAPALAVWVVVEAELDACAVHHACGGTVGVLAALTNTGKPDMAAHQWLTKAKRILVALDFDAADAKGNRPGYQGWRWWHKAYASAWRWPVPQGKDPGEAFAQGVDLAAWILAAAPELASGSLGPSDSGLHVVGEGADDAVVYRWHKAGRNTPLAEAVYPEDFPLDTVELRACYAGQDGDDDDVLIPCPSTSPPWAWRYRGRCRACAGHLHCLADFIFSPQMLAPLEETLG